MRKTQATLNDPLNDPINDSIFTTGNSIGRDSTVIQTFNDGSKRRCRCLTLLWLMSNILTFTAGYYVKTTYFIDDCSTDGSL